MLCSLWWIESFSQFCRVPVLGLWVFTESHAHAHIQIGFLLYTLALLTGAGRVGFFFPLAFFPAVFLSTIWSFLTDLLFSHLAVKCFVFFLLFCLVWVCVCVRYSYVVCMSSGSLLHNIEYNRSTGRKRWFTQFYCWYRETCRASPAGRVVRDLHTLNMRMFDLITFAKTRITSCKRG